VDSPKKSGKDQSLPIFFLSGSQRDSPFIFLSGSIENPLRDHSSFELLLALASLLISLEP
jgi:hypothetical protein